MENNVSSDEHKSRPQQVIYYNDNLMHYASELFRSAFGKDLFINFRGGRQIPIHVGAKPPIENGEDRLSDSYIDKVRANPLLNQQGDGMKSYAGILFEAIITERDITLIDEPEAFLHPPQMRLLGETLAREVRGQLFVATHSSDILRGFLTGTQGGVRILRIQRDGDGNSVFEAAPEVIKELWERPILRYSNALEGIFHEQTIICEDDSDCRLMNAVADFVKGESQLQWADTAYVPAGGKHNIPKIASALRGIGVPVKAIFDLDFLADSMLAREAVKAFGGKWEDIETLWNRIDSAVREGKDAKTIDEIKSKIIELCQDESEKLPKKEIIELMKQKSVWWNVRRYGEDAFPRGNVRDDFKQLNNILSSLGIFLVTVGEVENFCPDIGGHGPKFVTNLLSKVSLKDERLRGLREFVKAVHLDA